jgi:hypothetical protein
MLRFVVIRGAIARRPSAVKATSEESRSSSPMIREGRAGSLKLPATA